ncbi:hypothetical protein [Mycetocola tolaasinivorans]|uniref:hypothetical protein n=1 Tax=Mycetocola tolaasinivorans TaxID=76635 RepID=UPI0011C39490|nr:hypothetical protein [Mycetocola tolaasinivorans]
MRIKAKSGIVTVALFTLPSGLLVGTPAFANDGNNEKLSSSSSMYSEAQIFLTEYGVSLETQHALFEKLEKGEKWDSFSSLVEPTSSESYVENGYEKTVAHYNDGSVSVSRIELPIEIGSADLAGRSSPSGCSVGRDGARNNCTVDTWVGLIKLGFKANYNVNSNRVSNVWGATWAIGGSCSSSLVYLGTPNRNLGQMTVSAQMCAIPYATAFNLAVTVSGGKATKSWW